MFLLNVLVNLSASQGLARWNRGLVCELLRTLEVVLKNLLEHSFIVPLEHYLWLIQPSPDTWTRASSRILLHGLVTDFLPQCSFTMAQNVPRPRPNLQFIHCWVFTRPTWSPKHDICHINCSWKKGGVGIFTSVSTVLHGTFGQLLSLKLPNFPSLFASQL